KLDRIPVPLAVAAARLQSSWRVKLILTNGGDENSPDARLGWGDSDSIRGPGWDSPNSPRRKLASPMKIAQASSSGEDAGRKILGLPSSCNRIGAPRHIRMIRNPGEAHMASTLAKRLIRHDAVCRVEELSDEELLEQFLTEEGLESEEAFRALVVRHGPMVLGICRHVLNQDQDAEDAFQATFLVLARKGGSIRNRRVLSGWLHEVAYRIAIKSRASA